MNRGDRLAFSNGILGLAVLASVLIVIFDANVSRLINLYVMGVFTALTLSQTGMVQHWRKERATDKRWLRNAVINGIGAVVTLVVLVIVLITRFTHGGWMVAIASTLLVIVMGKVNAHYTHVGAQLRVPERRPAEYQNNHVILLVGSPSPEEARAFWYAERIRTDDFHAVHFAERGDPKGLEAQWTRQLGLLATTPTMDIVPTTGSIAASLRAYIERTRNRVPREDFLTVIVSERIKQGQMLTLGTRQGLLLKLALLFTPDVVVTNIPYIQNAPQTALDRGAPVRHVVLVLVPAAHNASLHALAYAKTLSADEIRCVHVALDPEFSEKHVQDWDALATGFPLEVVDSPFRRLGPSVREYVRGITREGTTIVTVILAEFVVKKWWQRFLHNQNAFDLKWIFLAEPDVIVTSVPYHL
jgi:hypothetical protein